MTKVGLCLLSFLTVLVCNHAESKSVVISDAFLDRLGDHEKTLQIETQLVDLLAGNDKKALKQLANNIKKEDGGDIYQLLKSPQLDEIALKLGPCHHAGLHIRAITTALVAGRLQVKRQQGFLTLSPGGLDDQFVEHMYRCELVKKYSKTERKLGTTCYVDGRNCLQGD
jgi:hypothetical protein